jgi:hypothetical protein
MPAINLSASVGRGGVNHPADVREVKIRLRELGFDWLDPDTVMGPQTISTIQLFQSIKNGFQVVSGDGRIDVNGSTHQWLNASNAPRWMQIPAGSRREGFINDELADVSDNHDFGTSWIAETLRGAGLTYRADFLGSHRDAARIHINDISMPHGGQTPDHATHQTGLCCDIKLPRRDGKAGGITFESPSYDRQAMRAILRALLAQQLASRVLFNDPVLVAENLCIEVTGHHDHVHFDIHPPARQMATRAAARARRAR